MNKLLKLLKSYVYPEKCLFCGDIIVDYDKKFRCDKCRTLEIDIEPDFCKKCGGHVKDGHIYCNDCGNKSYYFDKAGAIWNYENASYSIFYFKYKSMTENGKIIARHMSKAIAERGFKDVDLIIPVPLHYSKKRRRGFNQAAILAKFISINLGIEMDEKSLKRTKKTKSQMTLNIDEREENIKGSMTFSLHSNIKGKKILLIDDIFTTGSTLNECAKTLKEHGAEKVFCFCALKTNPAKQKPSPQFYI